MKNIILTDRQNRFIDILKGICIIFIVITHFSWTDSERLNYFFPFWIKMAVPIFMIISGYVNSLSYQKHKILKLEEAYLVNNYMNKIIRYTIPFLMMFLFEEIVGIFNGDNVLSVNGVLSGIKRFLQGGLGPGSYYYPIMIQFVFLYPVIYFTIKKYKYKGVWICGLINAFYEVLQWAYGMNSEFYRMILLRYVLVIAVGCYIADENFKMNYQIMVISFVIGIMFIIACEYLGYKPRIIRYWTGTSFVACLYIIPIIMLVIKKLSHLRCKMLEWIGKASYNIFLTQMVYYAYFSAKVTELISSRTFNLVLNVVICISIGIIFYYIEMPITKWVNRKIYRILEKVI